jgi:hypothetical protein
VSLQNLLVYFCDCKKKKRITEPMCDCNYLACVIATRSYVCCKWKPDFVCVLARLLGCLEYDCKPGCKWLQKTKVCHCKNCWFIFVTAKKRKRKTEPVCDCNYLACVIATRSYVCCKWKHDFVCVLEKLLGCFVI